MFKSNLGTKIFLLAVQRVIEARLDKMPSQGIPVVLKQLADMNYITDSLKAKVEQLFESRLT